MARNDQDCRIATLSVAVCVTLSCHIYVYLNICLLRILVYLLVPCLNVLVLGYIGTAVGIAFQTEQ